MNAVAVLDVGKTNVKLSVASRDGAILETASTANDTTPGPPYKHVDLDGLEDWVLGQLSAVARRHPIRAFVACGHGSAGVVVDDNGPVMPMMDYEQDVPDDVNRAYRALAGTVEERGSPIMAGAAHLARQLLWIEMEWPEVLARGRWFLGAPQYWAWRLSGVAATELTYLGAQSQLWDIPARSYARIVEARRWERLLPAIQPAWHAVGRLKAELARRHNLPADMAILCGIHDSSADFYRYQQAGLADLAVISTGTWIVGLCDAFAPEALSRTSGMTWNTDAHGRPLTGMLAMGGREFGMIAGEGASEPGDLERVAALIERETMALPSFANDDGPFAGSARQGRIVGPAPESPAVRRALAILYAALLTDACLDLMGRAATTVLDGSFVKDPLYPGLVAALRPGTTTLFSVDAYGTAAGAALLADHATRVPPAPVSLETPRALQIPGLDAYRKRWRDLAGGERPEAAMEAQV